MHGPEGVKPLNWQKPDAGPIHFSEKDSTLEMFTRRKKTGETLTVMFEQIFTSMLWHALDGTEIEIYGDESDLVKYLVTHPELIEKGFKVVKTEFQTKVGPVDIKGRDSHGSEVIVEVKKRNASPADAHQLKRYVEYFKDTEEKNIRAIMVAPDFPKNVQEYLEKNDITIRRIPWSEIFPVIQRPKSSKLEDFFGNKKEEKKT
ncbi:Endonuclease NucS [subsurface metagenome]